MEPKLNEKDFKILALLQENCRMTAKKIARKIDSPVTTVFARVKRMEKLGIIKDYKAVLDAKKLHRGTAAFILASFSYSSKEKSYCLKGKSVGKLQGFLKCRRFT